MTAAVISFETGNQIEAPKIDWYDFLRSRMPLGWYTSKRPKPKMMAGRPWVSPKDYDALRSEWESM